MKIVLLGKKGMLGNQFPEKLQTAKARLGGDIEIFTFDHSELDVTDTVKLREVMMKISPDIVINCIAYTNVDLAETERENSYLLNAVVPTELAKILSPLDAILVHFSTDYVFDGQKPLFEGYKEDDPTNPVNYYGETKLAGEKGIEENIKKYYILRTSWLYGRRIENRGKNFVDTMLKLGREVIEGKREKLAVVSDQFGCPTLTSDLAQSVIDNIVMKYDSGSLPEFGIYHQSNDDVTNWNEFASEIFKINGMDLNVEKITTSDFPTPAKRPLNSILLNTKLPRLRAWDEALREYLNSSPG